MTDTTIKARAKDHESYATFSIITIIIPIVGFILGIAYMTKDAKVDRKLGEHLLVLSIIVTVIFTLLGVLYALSRTQVPIQ